MIVYYPAEKEFYRYCHLQEVFVKEGDIIADGTMIGSVGHSGTNASKPGRGEHLHLEINQYRQATKKIRPLLEDELREKISRVK